MASPVQAVDGSGWAFHGPIVQKGKTEDTHWPRAKGCAIYCPSASVPHLDLPTTERPAAPARPLSSQEHPLPEPIGGFRPPQLPKGQQCYLPPLGLEAWASHTARTQTPVRTGSEDLATARLRGSAQALLPPVAGRMGRSGGGLSWSGSGSLAPVPSARGVLSYFYFQFKKIHQDLMTGKVKKNVHLCEHIIKP